MINQKKIHNQCLSDNREERKEALDKLRDKFSLLPDKLQAWNDLIKLTTDEDRNVRSFAATALVSVFSYVPDKKQVLNDLEKLANHKDSFVRNRASAALVAFTDVPDKRQAREDTQAKQTKPIDDDILVSQGLIDRIEDLRKHIDFMSDQLGKKDDQISQLNEIIQKQAVHIQSLIQENNKLNMKLLPKITENIKP